MSSIITKIRLINFRRFSDYTVTPNERINILVGDNEVGKSSILEAIDLVASGNVRRVESIGLDRLINIEAIKNSTLGGDPMKTSPFSESSCTYRVITLILQCAAKITQTEQSVTGFVWYVNQIQITELK